VSADATVAVPEESKGDQGLAILLAYFRRYQHDTAAAQALGWRY
jgi:hypothetical protein